MEIFSNLVQKITNIVRKCCSVGYKTDRVLVVFLSGPSGVGKTTIESKLLKMNKNWTRLKSTTTRARRDSNDNLSYNFVSLSRFKEMVKKEGFIFHMKSNYSDDVLYGFAKIDINKAVKCHDVITINAHASSVKIIKDNLKKMGIKNVSIFISPPSIVELKKRIQNRNSESQDDIKVRLSKAKDEIKFAKTFDYQIINDNLNKTIKQINRIIYQNLK